MKIHCVEQGTSEWLMLRLGKPTASEFKEIMTPKFAARDGKAPHTYLCEKVAEAITKRCLPNTFSAFATEQGQMIEPKARAWFEMEYDCEIRQVGFVEAEDGKSGCSPDGLCEAHGFGLELKCPFPHTQVKRLMEGVLPEEYVAQVHGSMYVTGLKEWRFLSYCRDLPPFVLTVKRDEAIIAKIAAVIDRFHETFTDAMESIKALSNKP